MAKKDIVYVDAAEFEKRIVERGLTPLMQAGFVKVEVVKGRTLYIAKTKKVGRVDLSGFEVDSKEYMVNDLGGEAFGAVKQQLNFSKLEGEDDATASARVLVNFEKLLDHMAALTERVREKKGPAGETKGAKPKGWTGAGGTKTEVEAKEAKGGGKKPDNKPPRPEGTNKNKPMSELTDLKAKAERLANIKRVAEEKGLPVSPKTLAQLEEVNDKILALTHVEEEANADAALQEAATDAAEEIAEQPAT